MSENSLGDIDELMAQIPMDQLSAMLGIAPAEAETAVRGALPALLAGMQANAQDPSGAASLADALGRHDGSLLDGGVDFGQVDTGDGSKIVSHVFGANEEAVVNQLGNQVGNQVGGGLGGLLSGGMMTKLLPLLAPLVMAWLAKSFNNKGKAADSGSPDSGSSDSDSGGGLGGLLGGGGLGDLLGGLFGGGSKSSSDQGNSTSTSGGGSGGGGGLGGLGDVFGDLLGGGTKK